MTECSFNAFAFLLFSAIVTQNYLILDIILIQKGRLYKWINRSTVSVLQELTNISRSGYLSFENIKNTTLTNKGVGL